ncbi:Flavodoxin, putative [Angomonas deanei]|uniref:Flavodoxin, putative n=1 Tax=Angomonas deanei TaxID=59799 RepID=A0A7G2C0J1_9TRYP|nr:Flavodoxin, putative [Angomonas deanei]
MTLFDIQPLFKGLTKPTVEGGVSTIASTAPDLLTWCESILDNLPGVTATEERIKQSVGWFFEASVTSTFLSVHDDPSRNREKEKGKPSHHHHARVERGAKAVGTRDRDLVKDILTPLVILYSSGDSIIQSIAKDLGELAESNYLHCVVSELSNIRRVGFPRKATFLFVVSGEITKSSSKLLKSLPSISNDKKTFELVKFAILGIAQSSRNEKFNAFALELETLLLSLHANKIHCTALADVDLPGELNRVVESFKSNLWGAIMKPSTSAAYLDANSPNISCCHKFPSSSFSADSEQSPLLASSSGAAIGTVNLSGGVAVTWDSIPVFREAAAELPVAFLYSSSGMSRTIATIAVNMATASGFTKVVLKSFSKYYEVDTSVYANWILFCESTPDGLSNGGVRLRRFLQNPSRQPDDLSHIQFSVLGLGSVNPNVTHPAFGWAALLSNLQANRVFPVAVMQSMSQVHSIGVPWTECVLATMTMLSPCRATTKPKEPAVNPVEFPLVNAKHILFLYGSSNGVTESIARDLHLDAKRRGYVARIGPLRSYDKMNFLSTPTIVLLTSTINTNFGGLPKTCEGFANFIFDKDHIGSRNLLYGTRFAVLGTGK